MMRVFNNRWRALFWSAGVIFFALRFVWPTSHATAADGSSVDDNVVVMDALGQPVDEQQVKDLQNAIANL